MKNFLSLCFIILVLGACSPVEFRQATCEEGQNCSVSASGATHVDKTITIAPPQADILIINDNSGSMSTEQNKMSERFPDFINSLSGVDFRIAVTTTDVSSFVSDTKNNFPNSVNQNGQLQDGRFITFGNGAQVLTPGLSNIVQLFEEVIERPETVACENSGFDSSSCPSPDERAIFAANLAVERGQSDFFRPGAHLAMIILSDEDERSRSGEITGFGLSAKDQPQSLIDNVKNRFGVDKSFAVHSIIVKPGDTSCLQQQNGQSGVSGFEGKIYKELSDLTNGRVGSICASNYGQELGAIGGAVVDAVNSLSLECAPKDNQVGVFVNPPPQGLTFEVDAANKRIQFNQTLPAGGSVRLIYDCES